MLGGTHVVVVTKQKSAPTCMVNYSHKINNPELYVVSVVTAGITFLSGLYFLIVVVTAHLNEPWVTN